MRNPDDRPPPHAWRYGGRPNGPSSWLTPALESDLIKLAKETPGGNAARNRDLCMTVLRHRYPRYQRFRAFLSYFRWRRPAVFGPPDHPIPNDVNEGNRGPQ